MMVMKVKRESKRLSREQWLEKALEVLSQEGSGKLRIQGISEALGVSKGSFYWHFEGREDFLRAITAYWEEQYTLRVHRTAEAVGGSGRDRLRVILGMVVNEGLTRYDAAFDAWAAHEPTLLPVVSKVHDFRYHYVRSLFAMMGFGESEAAIRTAAFLGFLGVHSRYAGTATDGRSAGDLDAPLEFFVRAN